MNKIVYLMFLAVIAAIFTGCTPPANTNTAANANTNANTKPGPAAPTVAALKEIETKAFEAYKNKDGKFFEGMLDDKFVMGGMAGQKVDKAATVKEISEHKCVINSFAFADEKMVPLGADAAAIVMKVTVDGTCPDAKGTQEKMPSPAMSASVYVRSGETWKAAYHNEIPVVDPKAAPAKTDEKAAPAPPAKKEEAKPPVVTNANKPAAGNTNAASKSTASNSNTANSANASASTSSDMTAAWADMEKKGWEAWQKKDPAWFESNLASNMLFVDLFGSVAASKADAIKRWTTDNKCEISSVSITDTSSVSLGKDAGILMYKGDAKGTCEGMAVKPLWGTTILVNEGGTWKAAVILENPA